MCVVRLALPAALVDPRFSVYLVGVGEGRGVGGREALEQYVLDCPSQWQGSGLMSVCPLFAQGVTFLKGYAPKVTDRLQSGPHDSTGLI